MRELRVLNLYSGIGGNRKLWGDRHDITAVEINHEVAEVYKTYFPNDNVIVADAHDYLLNHFAEFDFIWASPPCQSHSRMILSGTNRKKKVYPDMKLYQEIILLKHQFKGMFIVENVKPYYKPLIPPDQIIDRHFYWSSFTIKPFHEPSKKTDLNNMKKIDLIEWLGYENNIPNIYLEGNHCNIQILRNCVHPQTGLHIFNCAIGAYKLIQYTKPNLNCKDKRGQIGSRLILGEFFATRSLRLDSLPSFFVKTSVKFITFNRFYVNVFVGLRRLKPTNFLVIRGCRAKFTTTNTKRSYA